MRALVVSVLQSDRKAGFEKEKMLVVAPEGQSLQIGYFAWTEIIWNLELNRNKREDTLATHTPSSDDCCLG